MELIHNNPYRIAGVLSGVTTRELQKQQAKIKAFVKVGKEIKSDYDFAILKSISRNEDSINKAFSGIEQNQDKVNNSFFWFTENSPLDKTAIEYLKKGDENKAIEIWEKVTLNKEVNLKNFSAFNNVGTCKLLSQSKDLIKEGIEAKLKLIESDYHINFIHFVADETYLVNKEKLTESLIDELLASFKEVHSSSEIVYLFNSCSKNVQTYISKKITEEPLHYLENQIEKNKSARKSNTANAYELGLELYANTKEQLSTLKSFLGDGDVRFRTISDQIAKQILQCGIDYFNGAKEGHSTDIYLNAAYKLTRIADSIAVDKITKDRIKDSLATLDDMKDQGLREVVDLLQSVKDAYEENESNIRRQVKELKETDEFRFGLKSINQTAVEDNIKNSIDWSKVNDLLESILNIRDVESIKHSSNNELKSNFTELSNWLLEFSQRKHVISRFLNRYKEIPPKLSFKIVSSEVVNTDDESEEIKKPLYTKFVRYLGLRLNIEAYEDAEVTFYLKYIKPDGNLKRNKKSSPIGYSLSSTRKINTQSNVVDLTGWGNAKECTYDVGEHTIEVYMDEYLIHSKKYTVDVDPIEKLQGEINRAEYRLLEIKRKEYYAREIKIAKGKLSEIKKFQLFRGSSEKQRQIKSQEDKISSLIRKSKSEKNNDVFNQEKKINELKQKLSVLKQA